jgi:GT2 family glycosyltransferase
MISPPLALLHDPGARASGRSVHGRWRTGRGIIHIDLSRPFPDRVETGPFQRNMVVFWWTDIPIGHVFVETHRCSPERIAALAESAVEDDLITLAEERAAAPQRARPVSVVVYTRDQPQELAGCLDSLLAQRRPADEIVIVDDGSVGPAARRIAAERPRTVYRRQEPRGRAAARNVGLRAATHELIAFTDDVVRYHPLWLDRLVQPLEQSRVMATAGLVLPFEIETEAQYVCERAWSLGRGYRPRSFDRSFLQRSASEATPVWEIGAGVSMAFRRNAFQQAGPFDESNGAAETDIWYRLLAQGWECRYEPAAVAYHRHRRELDDLAEQVRERMSGHVMALLLQRDRHGDRGSLRRVGRDLPLAFLKLGWSRITQGRRPVSAMLTPALQGYCSGLAGYARHRRLRASPSSPAISP